MQETGTKAIKDYVGWMSRTIHWCKKLKFQYINKRWMDKAESVIENETHYILWDFKIQKDLQTWPEDMTSC